MFSLKKFVLDFQLPPFDSFRQANFHLPTIQFGKEPTASSWLIQKTFENFHLKKQETPPFEYFWKKKRENNSQQQTTKTVSFFWPSSIGSRFEQQGNTLRAVVSCGDLNKFHRVIWWSSWDQQHSDCDGYVDAYEHVRISKIFKHIYIYIHMCILSTG